MATEDIHTGSGDHLKYYCIVFGILVIVIGVVALTQRGALEEYRAANKQAHSLLTAQGTTSDGRPRAVGDLAVEVEKFVKGFEQSSGGGSSDEGISSVRMKEAEFAVQLEHNYAGPVNKEPNRGKGYLTTSREFTFNNATLEQLVKLVWNIESWGRYRVFEVRWRLTDKKENSEPPFNRISKPVIKVGFRTPITRER